MPNPVLHPHSYQVFFIKICSALSFSPGIFVQLYSAPSFIPGIFVQLYSAPLFSPGIFPNNVCNLNLIRFINSNIFCLLLPTRYYSKYFLHLQSYRVFLFKFFRALPHISYIFQIISAPSFIHIFLLPYFCKFLLYFLFPSFIQGTFFYHVIVFPK